MTMGPRRSSSGFLVKGDPIVDGWVAQAQAQPTFGQPFAFGKDLKFCRHPPQYLTDVQLRSLAYLDPAAAVAWQHAHTARYAPIVRAKVVHASQQDVYAMDQMQTQGVAPVAAAMVSRAPVLLTSGLRVSKATGVALREWGALYPQAWQGPDYAVVERLDRADGRRAAAGRGARAKQVTYDDDCGSCCEDDTPGPGQYDVDVAATKGKGPAFTMRGKPAGTTLVKPDADKIPGPGAYGLPAPAVPAGPAFTMNGRPRAPSTAPDDLPGPGEYDVLRNSATGPAFTIPSKPKRKLENDVPGPGEYDVAKPERTGPAVTIAGKPRTKAPEQLPGPQDYQQAAGAGIGKEGPAFSIYGRLDPKPGNDVPAPGDYEVPLAWRTGPAVTFAGKPAEKPDPEPLPGPGHYHKRQPAGIEVPAFSFGRRLTEHVDEVPGPGEYFVPTDSPGPAFTIAARTTSPGPEREAAQVPGPGAYSVGPAAPDSPSAPAYTMRARVAPESPTRSPGPAAYHAETPSKGPAYTMGARSGPAEPAPPDSPGPGAYPGAAEVHERGPAFTMGTRPQERDPKQDLPAPGEYDQPEAWRQGPAYTMRSRAAEPRAPDSPGPGEYVQPAADRGPAFSMASRPAPPEPAEGVPGPGEYEVVGAGATDQGPAFSMGARPEDRPRPPSPGPGEYARPLPPSGPAFSIPGKAQDPEPQSPHLGPGAYNPDKPLPSAPAFTIRARPLEPQPEALPGPGEYGDLSAGDTGPAWTMGTRPELPNATRDVPAPGQYDLPASPSGPAYTMRTRPKEPQAPEGPGPGEYAAASSPDGPAYTLRGKLADPERPPLPGPADYQKLAGPAGPAFTMAGRHHELKVYDDIVDDPDIPGPGFYGDPNPEGIGRSGPAYTMRPRLPEPDHNTNPGPGEYAAPASPSGPAYTMRGRPPSPRSADSSPGPGAYVSPTRRSGPAFTLGVRIADPAPLDTPAPGEYGSPGGGPSGPAFSLYPRLEQGSGADGPGPGPGEYFNPEGSSGPAFTMGAKLKRKCKKKRSALPPEPGQYYQPPAPDGPAWSFGAKGSGPTPWKPDVGPGDYGDDRDLHTGPAWTLRPKPPPPEPPPGPGPGHYYEARPFPSPLGKVVSILKSPARARDEPTLVDYGDPHAPTMTPGRKRVSFTGDTHFRDSVDPTLGGRVRVQEPATSGPAGDAVSYLLNRRDPSPPMEQGPAAARAAARQAQGGAVSQQQQQHLRGPAGDARGRDRSPERGRVGRPAEQRGRHSGGGGQGGGFGRVAAADQLLEAGWTAAGEAAAAGVRVDQLAAMYLQASGVPSKTATDGSSHEPGPQQRVAAGRPTLPLPAQKKKPIAAPWAAAAAAEAVPMEVSGMSAGAPAIPPVRRTHAAEQQQADAAARAKVVIPPQEQRGRPASTGSSRPPAGRGQPDAASAASFSFDVRPVTQQAQLAHVHGVRARVPEPSAAVRAVGAAADAARYDRRQAAAAGRAAPAPGGAGTTAAAAAAQRPPRPGPGARPKVGWLASAAAQGTAAASEPPLMTQGPAGMPVPRAVRSLDMASAAAVDGPSPRDAALARAAAYMRASSYAPGGAQPAPVAASGATAPQAQRLPAANVSTQTAGQPRQEPPRMMSAPAMRNNGGRGGAAGRAPHGGSGAAR